MTYVRPTGNVLLRSVLEPRRVTATRGRRRGRERSGPEREQEPERSGPGGGFGNTAEPGACGDRGPGRRDRRAADRRRVHGARGRSRSSGVRIEVEFEQARGAPRVVDSSLSRRAALAGPDTLRSAPDSGLTPAPCSASACGSRLSRSAALPLRLRACALGSLRP